MHPAFQRARYVLKRKLISFGTTKVYDDSGALMLFAKAAILKWHGLKVFSEEEMINELFSIEREFGNSHSVLTMNENSLGRAFKLIFRVTDTASQRIIGGFKRMHLRSIFRDEWLILSPEGMEIGKIQESNAFHAFLARIIGFLPQKYVMEVNGVIVAEIKQRFTLWTPTFDLNIIRFDSLSKEMILAGALLIGSYESILGDEG